MTAKNKFQQRPSLSLMTDYKLSNAAKDDLIRIYPNGVKMYGMAQADKYFDSFFEYFDIIAQSPYSFEQLIL